MDRILNIVLVIVVLAIILRFGTHILNNLDRINSKLEVVRICVMQDKTPECLKKGE